MLTAQSKPTLNLWVIFLFQLKKQKQKSGGKSVRSLLKKGKDRDAQRDSVRDLGATGWSEEVCKLRFTFMSKC